MLHALYLGIFKYTDDCLFKQIGETSQIADDFSAYAQKYGTMLSRQSQRDLPKTTFGSGIKRGKLMAMQNNGSYPNFGEFSQTFGVNAKILGFYT